MTEQFELEKSSAAPQEVALHTQHAVLDMSNPYMTQVCQSCLLKHLALPLHEATQIETRNPGLKNRSSTWWVVSNDASRARLSLVTLPAGRDSSWFADMWTLLFYLYLYLCLYLCF